jgi:hypothetical protein
MDIKYFNRILVPNPSYGPLDRGFDLLEETDSWQINYKYKYS